MSKFYGLLRKLLRQTDAHDTAVFLLAANASLKLPDKGS